MHTRRLAAATIATGILASATAPAQTLGPFACGDREVMVQRLERAFGEVQKGAGLVSAAKLIEVWRSDETGTWTILMTDADGRSCVIAVGEAWRDIDGDLAKGDPA